MLKNKKKVWRDKASFWTRLKYDTDFGIIRDKELKITIINSLRALMEKVDNMQDRWVMYQGISELEDMSA